MSDTCNYPGCRRLSVVVVFPASLTGKHHDVSLCSEHRDRYEQLKSAQTTVKPASAVVEIDYTNWRGERGIRQIVPQRIKFSTTPHHVEPQWLLDAFCLEKQDLRTFSMKDIHSWRPVDG